MSKSHWIKRKLGQFEISEELLWESELDTLLALMGKMVVLRVEHRPDRRTYIYLAMSDLFDEVEPYSEAPWYTFEFTKAEGQPAELSKTIRLDPPLEQVAPPQARIRRIIEEA